MVRTEAARLGIDRYGTTIELSKSQGRHGRSKKCGAQGSS